MGLNNLAIAESVVIEERIRPNVVSGYNSSTGALVRLFTLMNQDYKAEILPIYARGGTFYVTGGTNTPYSVDTWYTLRMVLNYENGVYTSYDLYIDSAKVAENIAMPTNFNSLKFVSLIYFKKRFSFVEKRQLN